MAQAVPPSGLEVHWLENGPSHRDGPSRGVLAVMVLDRSDPE